MKHTLVARYTTEHAVEYVIVWFFIWGLADVAFRACMFPSEMLALQATLAAGAVRANRCRTARCCWRKCRRSRAGCKSRASVND